MQLYEGRAIYKVFSLWFFRLVNLNKCHCAIHSFLIQIAGANNLTSIDVLQLRNLLFQFFHNLPQSFLRFLSNVIFAD